MNVLEKLVKPSVRRAPEGAFRYVRGIMDKPFKTYTELLDFLEKEKRLALGILVSRPQALTWPQGVMIAYQAMGTKGYRKDICLVPSLI